MKTLHVLRHAKSDWSDPTLDDHDRPLSPRGLKGRQLVADHVRGWPVDLVVCSTARRARETADPVVEALGCPITFDAAIYDASAGQLVEVVQGLPDEAGVVLLVGHNPGSEHLTQVLCGVSPPYPTAALGTIELDADTWAEVELGTGRLVEHVTPAQLRSP